MSTAAPPPLPAPQILQAPAHWRAIDIVSDLHLCEALPRTFEVFRQHLQHTDADAVLLLGDIFEAWVGDDLRTQPFEATCVDALREGAAHTALWFMCGNRDFLVGADLLQAAGAQRLADPTLLCAWDQRWLLSHGDALCLADTDYLRFRAEVRTAEWQAAFLARPLSERQALGRQMRAASQAKGRATDVWADVDDAAAAGWVQQAGKAGVSGEVRGLIHGHTHRPAVHPLASGAVRWVLSDWDLDGPAPRAEVLRLDAQGLRRLAPCVRPNP